MLSFASSAALRLFFLFLRSSAIATKRTRRRLFASRGSQRSSDLRAALRAVQRAERQVPRPVGQPAGRSDLLVRRAAPVAIDFLFLLFGCGRSTAPAQIRIWHFL